MRLIVHRLRRGDEVRIEWPGGACWARVSDVQPGQRLVDVPRWDGRTARLWWSPVGGEGRYVVGRTTFGREVVAHEHWITDVRPEQDEALRASWEGRTA